jgi:ABC-2 type transport system permease protein
MRELWIIVEREFQERVRTRAFAIGTLIFPLFMAAVFLLPTMFGDQGPRQLDIAVVDRAPAGLGDVFVHALHASAILAEAAARAAGGDGTLSTAEQETALADAADAAHARTYAVRRLPADAALDELNRQVLAGDLAGYVVLPEDLLDGAPVMYRARTVSNPYVLRDVRLAGNAAVQASRMGAAGLDPAMVQQLLEPVDVSAIRITASGQEGGDAQGTFLVAYLLAFLAYMVIAMYGHTVMRSVIQEKVTRISEILVSSVRASHLMAGKIAGVSAAALLQVAIWVAMVALVVGRSELVQERFGISPAVMDAFRLEPAIGLVLALFFILGFLLFAALFAALGAAMSTEQEAQPFQMILMLPLFLPLLFLGPITTDPDGRIATVLSLLPLTSPVAMPMRLAAAPPDPLTIALALALLLLATAAIAWVAGKIYRVGILATGKRPSLGELTRWVRAA